jgi:hypothetical protein
VRAGGSFSATMFAGQPASLRHFPIDQHGITGKIMTYSTHLWSCARHHHAVLPSPARYLRAVAAKNTITLKRALGRDVSHTSNVTGWEWKKLLPKKTKEGRGMGFVPIEYRG